MSVSEITILLCAVWISTIVSGPAVRQNGKTCSVSDLNVNDGDIFELSVTGPCVKYLCQDGQVLPSQYGCERDGSCYPLGDTYTSGCFQRKCAPSMGNFDYVVSAEGCMFQNSCIPVSQTSQVGCFKYLCSKTGNSLSYSYSVTLAEWGCEKDSQCYPADHILQSGCNKLKCQNINGVVGFRAESQGCQLGSTCLQVGESTVSDCRTYQCKRTDVNGVPYYSVAITKSLCQDSNHTCRDPGTYFPYFIGGVLRPNCTCQVISTSVHYTC